MHARATVVITAQDRVDGLVAHVRDRALPLVLEQPGSLGLSMNVDRGAGRCTVTSIWQDEASMRAGTAALVEVRREAERLAAAPLVSEVYEVAVLHRLRQAEPGCWVRSTRVQLERLRMDSGVWAFRSTTLPALEALPGFRSALLLVDRRSGGGVVSVVLDDRAALDASREQAERLRRDSSAATGAAITSVVEAEIVVAGLRLPTQSDRAPSGVS